MIVQFRCSIDGGLMLIDHGRLVDWRSISPTSEFSPADDLSIALDVEGHTDQVFDWPDERWETVWKRETRGLVKRINEGELALLILSEGEFFVDIDVDGEWPALKDANLFEFDVQLDSGRLVVGDASKIPMRSREFEVECGSFSYVERECAPGAYRVSFIVDPTSPVVAQQRWNTYGSESQPFCFVRVRQSEFRKNSFAELPCIRQMPDGDQ